MPYRHRAHIICLTVSGEIFIRWILSRRTGHADLYSDIHISVAFTCMETIFYGFEGSFGIFHGLVSVKKPLLACGIRGVCRRSRVTERLAQFEGSLAHDGLLGTWINISALLWITMSWKLRFFCWVSWNHSDLTLKEQGRAQKHYYI